MLQRFQQKRARRVVHSPKKWTEEEQQLLFQRVHQHKSWHGALPSARSAWWNEVMPGRSGKAVLHELRRAKSTTQHESQQVLPRLQGVAEHHDQHQSPAAVALPLAVAGALPQATEFTLVAAQTMVESYPCGVGIVMQPYPCSVTVADTFPTVADTHSDTAREAAATEADGGFLALPLPHDKPLTWDDGYNTEDNDDNHMCVTSIPAWTTCPCILKLLLSGADNPSSSMDAVVSTLRQAVGEKGIMLKGMLSPSTIFALRCVSINPDDFSCAPYFEALRDNPGSTFARKLAHLACLHAKAQHVLDTMLRGATQKERVHLESAHSFLTAPLWVQDQPRHLFFETLPKPDDYHAVLDANLNFRHSGSPSKAAVEDAVLALVQPHELEAARENHADEFAMLRVSDMMRIQTTPLWSMLIQDLDSVMTESDELYAEPERAVAWLARTVLMANATNILGMAEALGIEKGGHNLSQRLCNWHANWWPASHGPVSRMRIPHSDLGHLAWLDSLPVVFQKANTDDLPKGLMEKGATAFAPLLRDYCQYILSPGTTVRLDTADDLQLAMNLYSTGCIHELQKPWCVRQPSGKTFEYHPACLARIVVTDFGKTSLSHLRKDSKHRSDTYLQTRCLIGVSLGFNSNPVVFSLSVVRGGAGTFQPPSDAVKSAYSYVQRTQRECEAMRVLSLSSDADFVHATSDVYDDLATEVRMMACDFVTVGMTVHRYFTRVGAGAPVARHIIPADALPVKMRMDRCWPLTVFAPVVAELQSLRRLRSGRKLGDAFSAAEKHATMTTILKYSTPPPLPWTKEAIPLPSSADAMLKRQDYWLGLKVEKAVYESLKEKLEWSRSNHLLMSQAVQKTVVLVLWASAHRFGTDCKLPREILDSICEYSQYM